MTFVTVWVNTPVNRRIFINGDYSQSAGNSSNDSFIVPTGGQFFETLNGARCVDYRKRIRVRSDDTELSIDLDPVNPPVQI